MQLTRSITVIQPEVLSSRFPELSVLTSTPQKKDPQVLQAAANTPQCPPDRGEAAANFRGNVAGDIYSISFI